MPGLMFILGTGRCGSILLYETLCMHPSVGFISSLDDRRSRSNPLGRANNRLYRYAPTRPNLKKHLAPSEGYRLLDGQVSPLLSQTGRDVTADDLTPWLTRRLDNFFTSRIDAQRLPLFAHKFTGWPRARMLYQVFPEARFIHVVRDGRAVANSLLHMPWWGGFTGPDGWRYGPLPPSYAEKWQRSQRSHVLLAGIVWQLLIDEFQLARAEIPDELWLEIRYEDLIIQPRDVLDSVLTHVGLPWSPDFERAFQRQRFSPKAAEAFRRDLSPGQVKSLDNSLGPHLRRFRYTVDDS